MRFYTTQHPFYCGIDLHARTMYVCILNQAGETLDIIGDSVYWLYANLCDLTRQTARVLGCDRTDA